MKYGWNIENELTFGEISRDYYYTNLLVDNIMAENLTEVRNLLETKKANPNTVMPELGVAPLHLLAGLENEDFSSTVTLQAILRSGGDPNIRSEEGLTPVHVAAMWGRCKVLDILLANGGDPELIDYKMFLNAEEYTIREQQWRAYGVLSTYSVMAEGGYKMDGQMDDKSHGSENISEFTNCCKEEFKNKHLLQLKDKATNHSENSSIKGSENSCRYSTVKKKKKSKKMNHTDDESRSDRSDWSKNTLKLLNLNGALSTIRRKSTARKEKKLSKKNQTDDESHSDRSDWSKNTLQLLNLNGALSTIKRKPTARKEKKLSKKNQTDDESHSDRSDWSKNTINTLKHNEGALCTAHGPTTLRKNNKVDKKNQTDNESHSHRSDWSKNAVKTLKPNEGAPSTITKQKKNNKIDKKNQTNYASHSDQSDWSKSTIQSLKLNDGALSTIKRQRRKTNIYESLGSISDKIYPRNKVSGYKEPKEKCNKLSLYGDNVSESCDWIRKSVNSIKLDKNALNTIKNQRLSSKIYQTKGLGEDPLKEREKKPPLYEESETCDWVDPRNSETFDESSLNKINFHRTRTTTYKSEFADDPMLCSGPKLPKRNRKMHHKKKEDSEMYLCGYTESSIRTNEHQRRPTYLSSGLSDVNSSDFDERGIPNQRMLCKMSRIFLFMLKKRHIYQKIK